MILATVSFSYQEFLKFAADFNLSSSVILSTLEIGDIYLSSVRVSLVLAVARTHVYLCVVASPVRPFACRQLRRHARCFFPPASSP